MSLNHGRELAFGFQEDPVPSRLDNGSTTNSAVPTPAYSSADVFAAGYKHTFRFYSAGHPHACGDNTSGQLGDGTTDSKTDVHIGIYSSVTMISAGETRSLALATDNSVWAWGGGTTSLTQVQSITDTQPTAFTVTP